MTKYYRVKQDTFLWGKGAVLASQADDNGYTPISDIWNVHEDQDEYISNYIVEKSPDWFGRVYEVSNFGKLVYVTKEKAQELAGKFFSGKDINETNKK